jgi:hypothetical protein
MQATARISNLPRVDTYPSRDTRKQVAKELAQHDPHDFVFIHGSWKCTQCGMRKLKPTSTTQGGCSMFKATTAKFHASHNLRASTIEHQRLALPIAFCFRCGGYATHKSRLLSAPCKGWRTITAAIRLRLGKHPATQQPLGRSVPLRPMRRPEAVTEGPAPPVEAKPAGAEERVDQAPVSPSPPPRPVPLYDPAELEDEAAWTQDMEEEAARALGLALDFD